MEIKEIIPRALATLGQPIKASRVNTRALEKFAAFQTLNDPQLELMKFEAERFVSEWTRELPFSRNGRWLSLLGTSGAGKTMLARLILNQTKGYFKAWTRIVAWTREGDHRLFEDLMREPVVCIDDVGGEYATDYSRAKLYEFLSEREKKWTVITANLSLEQVGDMLDARIASRMIRHGSVVVDVDVPDYNLRVERKADAKK